MAQIYSIPFELNLQEMIVIKYKASGTDIYEEICFSECKRKLLPESTEL